MPQSSSIGNGGAVIFDARKSVTSKVHTPFTSASDIPSRLSSEPLCGRKGEIGDGVPEIIPRLVEILSQQTYSDAGACRALRKLDPAAARTVVPGLIARLGRPEQFRGEHIDVVRAIASLGSEAVAAVSQLTAMLPDDEYGEVAEALGEIGPAAAPAVPALVELLRSGKIRNATRFIIALGKIGPGAGAAVPDLVEWLKDPFSLRTRDAAPISGTPESNQFRRSTLIILAHTLGQIGPAAQAAVPVLQELSHDSGESAPVEPLPTVEHYRDSRGQSWSLVTWQKQTQTLAEAAAEALQRIQATSDSDKR